MNRKIESGLQSADAAHAELVAIDRILVSEDALVPSSGFAAAVMERVREEAAAPAPIPFPWKRVAPGAAVAAVALGWGVFELAAAAKTLPATALIAFGSNTQALASAGWTALAVLASLLAWRLSRRMMEGRGLL